MKLTKKFKQYLPPHIRTRGQAYYDHGQVTSLLVDTDFASFIVEGSRSYDVDMEILEDDTMQVFCSCPYFAKEGNCKHLWACFLHVEKETRIFQYEFVEDIESLVQRNPIAKNRALNETGSGWRQKFKSALERRYYSQPQIIERPVTKQKHSSTRIFYLLCTKRTKSEGILTIILQAQDMKKNGEWSNLRPFKTSQDTLHEMFNENINDAKALQMLTDYDIPDYGRYSYTPRTEKQSKFNLDSTDKKLPLLLKALSETGRLRWADIPNARNAKKMTEVVNFDDGILQTNYSEEYQLEIDIENASGSLIVSGALRCGAKSISLNEPVLFLASGIVLRQREILLVDYGGNFGWIIDLRLADNKITIAPEDVSQFVYFTYECAHKPKMHLPDGFKLKEASYPVKPKLIITDDQYFSRTTMHANLKFIYGTEEISRDGLLGECIINTEKHEVIKRDVESEGQFEQRLESLGLTRYFREEYDYFFSPSNLLKIIEQLSAEGWDLNYGEKKLRINSHFTGVIASGTDWFDLTGGLHADGQTAQMPELLKAMDNQSSFLTLSDGSVTLIPEQLRKKLAMLARLGRAEGDSLRFNRSQAFLIESIMQNDESISIDQHFKKIRSDLQKLNGIKPKKVGASFNGTLRHYQEEGLAWLHFLNKFGFGGCLADEMGLGKTVQILAFLSDINAKRKASKSAPTLIVVPRSLVSNWLDEAVKFTNLKILDYSVTKRKHLQEEFANYDIVLTTYAIIRQDIQHLVDTRFHYVILDEAQNIKNPSSITAKAAKLIPANNRLCLTGTPIENSLNDLWSIFEFLNPGFLGTSSIAQLAKSAHLPSDPQLLEPITKALQPFILRRTKAEVLNDLPPKLEQVVYCDLPPGQRKEYDSLKRYYQLTLKAKVSEQGLNKSKMHVLEALLRLRQVACHPGLLDQKKAVASSAKMQVLLDHLQEIKNNGQKALVFSQFTSLLALVKKELKKRNLNYEYLDGQTKKRSECVDRFSADPECTAFLISLKAGGVGLNLTEAQYCFILDPWWNPAVEAQAIDRTHRIGQKSKVFAYKLIAKNTVEEKIIELQKRKNLLAESVITANGNLLKNISSQDLEFLLS